MCAGGYMSLYSAFEYREKFAIVGRVCESDIVTIMAELDPFLYGFFFALALGERLDLLRPVVDEIEHDLEYDTTHKLSRISIHMKIVTQPIKKQEYPMVNRYLNDAISAFLGSRTKDIVGEIMDDIPRK
jgi:hypothetical protein